MMKSIKALTIILFLFSCDGKDKTKDTFENNKLNDSSDFIFSKKYNISKDTVFFEKMFGGKNSILTIKKPQKIIFYKLFSPDPIQINDSVYILPKTQNYFHCDSILDGPNILPDRLKDTLINVLLDSNIYEWSNKYKLCVEKRDYGIRFIKGNDTVDVGIGAYCRNIYFYKGSEYLGYQYLKDYSDLFLIIHHLYPNDIFFEEYFQSELKIKNAIDLYSKIQALFVKKYELDKIEPIKNNNDTLAFIGFSCSQSLDSTFPKQYLSIIKSKINHSWISDENENFILHCFNLDMLSRFVNKNGIIELEIFIDRDFKIKRVKVLYNTINEQLCDCIIDDLKELNFSSHKKFDDIKKYLPVKIRHAWAILKKFK